MSVGNSQGIIKSCLQAFERNRILSDLIIRCARKFHGLLTNQSAIFRNRLYIHLAKRCRFHRKIYPIELEQNARQVTISNLNLHRTSRISFIHHEAQHRRKEVAFLIFQHIDTIVTGITGNGFTEQSQTFHLFQTGNPVHQMQINLRTNVQVAILLHPFAKLLFIGLRIGIKSRQEPCRTHALYLIYM